MKDLEKEVVTLAQSIGAPGFALIGPKQFYGLEINVFAQELASMVVWIGYLQWNRANGVSNSQEPILERLDNIRLHDALMNEDGTEYEWPEAEFIIGNPPFIGDKRMRSELGDEYVVHLRAQFKDRLQGQSDFVCYWLVKARAHIEQGKSRRVGMIATNSIRGSTNRNVLNRIKGSGDIFLAWSDEPWVLEGADVRVSIVGFDDGSETDRYLDGRSVATINSDLTTGIDPSNACRLEENADLAFTGMTPVGPFELPTEVALDWLTIPNPTNAMNSDVIRPFYQGKDVTERPKGRWIIDFGQLDQEAAMKYVLPFAHVVEHVRPMREQNRRAWRRQHWWLLGEPMPAVRAALDPLSRYLATSRVSKHRFFVWVDVTVLPGNKLALIADDSDYVFGVVSSLVHQTWSLAVGSWHGVGNDSIYTPTTCFETFPFPRPNSEQRCEVEKWAKYLDTLRNQILDSDEKLTMTKLYNELAALREDRDSSHRAYPLLVAHEKLDESVAAAYGWEWPLAEEVILERLLELNLERADEEREAAVGAD